MFKSTLISMIGTLLDKVKVNWQEHVSTLVNAYNFIKPNTTRFSPYYLMYWCHLVLLIDVEFGVRTPDLVASTTKNYVQKLKK